MLCSLVAGSVIGASVTGASTWCWSTPLVVVSPGLVALVAGVPAALPLRPVVVVVVLDFLRRLVNFGNFLLLPARLGGVTWIVHVK